MFWQAFRSKGRYSAGFEPTPAFQACTSSSVLENVIVCSNVYRPFDNPFNLSSLGLKRIWRELTCVACTDSLLDLHFYQYLSLQPLGLTLPDNDITFKLAGKCLASPWHFPRP